MPVQMMQVQSFWNLLQASGESVQKEVYFLLQRKYGSGPQPVHTDIPSFLQMKGILSVPGDSDTDKQMINEYLSDKYGE